MAPACADPVAAAPEVRPAIRPAPRQQPSTTPTLLRMPWVAAVSFGYLSLLSFTRGERDKC